eukprot:COSAG05_NODE_4769_length_1380_cov_0.982826_1_plen_353_part_00
MGKIGEEDVIVKEVKATKDAPLWRLFREVYIQAAASVPDAEGHHEHVTKLKGWSRKGDAGPLTKYTKDDCFYIVLEYAGTELHHYLGERGTMPPEVAYAAMSQMVKGLTHLHNRKFFHRDLRLENVAQIEDGSKTGRMRLIDFGSSTQVYMGVTMSAAKKKRLEDAKAAAEKSKLDQERAQQVVKSQKAHTRAPEIVTGQMVNGTEAASEKLDVWGLGVILFGLVFGKAPFGEQPATDEDFNQARNLHYQNCWDPEDWEKQGAGGVPQTVKDFYKEEAAKGTSGFEDLKTLLDNMLQANPEKRWSLERVRQHLKVLVAKPLSTWLSEEVSHPDKTGKPTDIKGLHPVTNHIR